MEELRDRVERFVREHELIPPGGDVTCLVSGGADSTCLWHVLGSMFVEYSKAVAVTARGDDGHTHMQNAWRLAHSVHDLLAGAKTGLGAQGCDVTPLLSS